MGCINCFAIGLQGADVVKWPPTWFRHWETTHLIKGCLFLHQLWASCFYPASSSWTKSNKVTFFFYLACFDFSLLHQHVFRFRIILYPLQKYSLCLCQTEQRCTQIWCIFPPVRSRNTQSNLIHAVQVVVKSCDSFGTTILDILHTSSLLDRVLCTVLLFLLPHSVS